MNVNGNGISLAWIELETNSNKGNTLKYPQNEMLVLTVSYATAMTKEKIVATYIGIGLPVPGMN